ncbi:3'(2'),5'-bisphosphate nucleotidase 1 [Cimex lectularius]|uniref:3'(2'),5'-bisphosphate nucleotidase 1 n=1 Tax=Cimex lectularius TaxID=79782 RepID=A0A8I6S905_CIMLE|nr:3'(2'),5'-bisphosphate nucleotidase 1 [Cimex lectularius]
MAQAAPLLLRLVGSSVTAATKAGTIIKDVMNKGDLGIRDKGNDDLQTEADRLAQSSIIASLSRMYQKVTIIGEEGPHELSNIREEWIANEPCESVLKQQCPEHLMNVTEEDVVIWIDPLDGTKEFTQGFLENITVLIGIVVGNKSVAGVIHQPYYKNEDLLGRTIWGIQGLGVGGFEPLPPPDGKFTITTSKSHFNPLIETAIELLQPDQVKKEGGAGYKVLMLMEGKAHAYVYPVPGTKRWDICAPEAILSAVGGKLTDMKGNSYPYDKNTNYNNTEGVVATCNDYYHKLCINRLENFKR